MKGITGVRTMEREGRVKKNCAVSKKDESGNGGCREEEKRIYSLGSSLLEALTLRAVLRKKHGRKKDRRIAREIDQKTQS